MSFRDDDETAAGKDLAEPKRARRHDRADLAAESRRGAPRRGQLGLDPALVRDGLAADRAERQQELEVRRERRQRAGDGDVVPLAARRIARELLRPRLHRLDVAELERRDGGLEEAHLLADGFDERDAKVGPGDRERDPRKSGPRAHVHQPCAPAGRSGQEQRERIEEVLRGDLLRRGDGGEVHLLVPLLEKTAETFEPIARQRVEAHRRGVERIKRDACGGGTHCAEYTRRVRVLGYLITVFVLLVVLGMASVASTTFRATIQNLSFSPRSVTIETDDSVMWTN